MALPDEVDIRNVHLDGLQVPVFFEVGGPHMSSANCDSANNGL
jgi:hypothetical protein